MRSTSRPIINGLALHRDIADLIPDPAKEETSSLFWVGLSRLVRFLA